MWHTPIFLTAAFPTCRCALKRTAPPKGSLKPVISMVPYYHLRGSSRPGAHHKKKKKYGKRVYVDAANKIPPAAGSEARSRPRTLLLCLNTQGRLIIMNYGNTTGTSVTLLVANSTTLRRAVSSAAHKFHFFARSSDFDTGVQVDSEIPFLSFARKSASATPVLSPWKYRYRYRTVQY